MKQNWKISGMLVLLLCCVSFWVQAGQRAYASDQDGNGIARRGPITKITVFFEMIPEECFFDPPTAEERQDWLAGKTVRGMKIGVRDVRNGYLNMVGAFEGVWEMCFWNTLSDKGKLVAVNARSCGPVCKTRLFFYRMGPDGNLIPAPDVRASLEAQLNPGDFYQTERMGPRELRALDDPAGYVVYDLPRLGRDIVVRRDENVGRPQGVPEYLARPVQDILFVWDGTTFTKQE
jgi:hypothetical protein